ncbi:MAG: hypothetical protein ACO1OB_31350 [Archangium sp.]
MRAPVTATILGLLSCAHSPAALDVRALRAEGPDGLDALLAKYEAASPEQQRELVDVIARVAGQRDAHVSRLYWYEDLDAALARSKATRKPVLSLRMLGRLDEELSCANSRFFRTTLYANARVSKYLRDNYVLHWSSERPVPVATIDFGDGRKVTRTVTGNSIHYVLDSNGFVVDALPGLYGAGEFVAKLERARPAAGMTPERRVAWHEGQVQLTSSAFYASMEKLGVAAFGLPSLPGVDADVAWPSSRVAVPIAVGKAIVESPMIRGFVPGDGGAGVDPTPWDKLANTALASSRLDDSARATVLSKNPVDVTSTSIPKLSDELTRELIAKLENAIALDTVRNEYALHPVIHRWLSENPKVSMKDLNKEVYARLFLTPASDPWLGLVPELAWTGLPNDGIEVTAR